MRFLVTILLALAATIVHAASMPYDEAADAKADIRTALAEASRANVAVLVVFGANWCGDCKVLDMALKEGTSATLIREKFKVVKVDVGRFDRNVDIPGAYRVPLKLGIPAIAVLSAKGDVLYATRDGELADARAMGDRGIHDFFARIPTSAK